jgi:hypothetical protein
VRNYTPEQLVEIQNLLAQARFTQAESQALWNRAVIGRHYVFKRARTVARNHAWLERRSKGRDLAQDRQRATTSNFNFDPQISSLGQTPFQTTFDVQGASRQQVIQAVHDVKPSDIAPVFNFTNTTEQGNSVSARGNVPFLPDSFGTTVSKTGTSDGADISADGTFVKGSAHISVDDDPDGGVRVTETGSFNNPLTTIGHGTFFDLKGAVENNLNSDDDSAATGSSDDSAASDQDNPDDDFPDVASADSSQDDGFADDDDSADDGGDFSADDGGGDDGGGDDE